MKGVVFFQTDKKVAPSSAEHSTEEGRSQDDEIKPRKADVSYLSVIFLMMLLNTIFKNVIKAS